MKYWKLNNTKEAKSWTAWEWISAYMPIAKGAEKTMVLKLEGTGSGLPWWFACTTELSDLWKCGTKPDQTVKAGFSLVLGCSNSCTDGNSVRSTGAQKAEVAVRMCFLNQVRNSDDTKSKCSSDCSLKLAKVPSSKTEKNSHWRITKSLSSPPNPIPSLTHLW